MAKHRSLVKGLFSIIGRINVPLKKMFSINNIEGRSKRIIFASDGHVSGVEK